MGWLSALDLLIELEGGYVGSNPPEGITFAGILKPYYDDWCKEHGRDATWPPTQEAIGSYYHDAYWTPFHCGDLPNTADAVALQLVVNLPVINARQAIQLALGVFPDGDIGRKTLAAIPLRHPADLADNLMLAQRMHYCTVRRVNDPDFKGLQDRVDRVKQAIAQGRI